MESEFRKDLSCIHDIIEANHAIGFPIISTIENLQKVLFVWMLWGLDN